jgi:hypothetical protein
LYRAAWSIDLMPINHVRSRYPARTIGVRFDHTRINSEAFALNETLIHAATQNGLEDMPQCSAVTKSSVSIPTESALPEVFFSIGPVSADRIGQQSAGHFRTIVLSGI